MCSLGNEDASSSFLPPKENIRIGTTCIKCRQAPSIIVLRSKDAYCKECFLKGTVHKFKSLLGKHKLIRPNDKVLIIFDGSASATAMLHFIRMGLDLDNPKRLKFEPFVIFIEPDENESNLTLQARKDKFNELTQAVEQHNFGLHFTSYTDYKVNPLNQRIYKHYTDYLERRIEASNHYTSNENQLNLSNNSLMKDHISRNHYIALAVELQCKFCFTTELAMDVAANIMSNIAFGRGGLLPIDVGAFDNRDPRVTIVRPMRLLDLNEVQFYNQIAELKTIDLEQFYLKNTCTYDSIQNLVKNFVVNLQENYPATVNTIVRTGDKLGILLDCAAKDDVCKLCKCPIERTLGILSSNEAIEFSNVASTVSDFPVGKDSFNSESQTDYCFSCRKIA